MKSFASRLGAAGLLGIFGCGEAERPARVVFSADPINLGILDPGESEFTTSFRNSGTGSLFISEVKSTCSCTQAQATLRVEPGGLGTLWGKVKVQGGPGGAKLTVTSNDPAGSRQVQIRWFGKTPPSLVPDALDVIMKLGKATSRSIEVSYPADDPPVPIEFIGAVGLPDGARISLVENNPVAIKGTPGLGASMTVAPSPFVGRATLLLELAAPKKSGITVLECGMKFSQRGRPIELPWKLTTRVDEGLRASPESLLFSASNFEALKQIRRKVILMSDTSGDQFRVVEKPDYLNVEMECNSLGSSTRAVLTAAVTLPAPVGETRPQLVLENMRGRRIAIAVHLGVDP